MTGFFVLRLASEKSQLLGNLHTKSPFLKLNFNDGSSSVVKTQVGHPHRTLKCTPQKVWDFRLFNGRKRNSPIGSLKFPTPPWNCRNTSHRKMSEFNTGQLASFCYEFTSSERKVKNTNSLNLVIYIYNANHLDCMCRDVNNYGFLFHF